MSLQIQNLTKQFGESKAVNSLQISLPKGEVLGLLDEMVQEKQRQSKCFSDY